MQLELNGTNVIHESERGGRASSLFWPWCGANVSLLALSYGSFFLGVWHLILAGHLRSSDRHNPLLCLSWS